MSEVSPEHSRQELEGLGFGPYEVNFVDSFVLELANREKISINVWFPGKCDSFFPNQVATVRYCDALQEDFEIEVGLRHLSLSLAKTRKPFMELFESTLS